MCKVEYNDKLLLNFSAITEKQMQHFEVYKLELQTDMGFVLSSADSHSQEMARWSVLRAVWNFKGRVIAANTVWIVAAIKLSNRHYLGRIDIAVNSELNTCSQASVWTDRTPASI